MLLKSKYLLSCYYLVFKLKSQVVYASLGHIPCKGMYLERGVTTSTTIFPKVNVTTWSSSCGCGQGCRQNNFWSRDSHTKKSHYKKWTKVGPKSKRMQKI